MKIFRNSLILGTLAVLFMGGSQSFAATTNSNQVVVALSAQVISSLAIASVTPAQVFGIVTPGSTTTAAVPVTVTSSWQLMAGQTVKLYAYFASSTSAMSGTLTGTLIPVSAFTGSVNGAASSSFSASNPFGGSMAIQMYSQTLTLGTAVSNRTDTLNLTMNLSGLEMQADNYAGTMYLQAQAL